MVVRVRVALPEPGAAMIAELKEAVVPVGRPETERLTALLKLPETVVVTVEVAEAPRIALIDVGATEIAKSEGAVVAQLATMAAASTVPRPVARS